LLADAIGNLDCRSKAIEAELKAAKGELTAHGRNRAEGERFTVIISQSIRINLDTAVIRAESGVQWCDVSALSLCSTMRVGAFQMGKSFHALMRGYRGQIWNASAYFTPDWMPRIRPSVSIPSTRSHPDWAVM